MEEKVVSTTTTSTAVTMGSRLKTMIRNRPKTVLGATVFLGAMGYRRYKAEKRRTEDAGKKKVLVLPFHRMNIVEEKKSPISSLVQQFSDAVENNGSPATEKVIEMQAGELVSLIDEAARDPSIVGLYGVFGNGGSVSTGGWAHLEEIRAALERFAKTTTSSSLPDDKSQEEENGLQADTTKDDSFTPDSRKTMYAYSNTFGGQQSMVDYYLASVFEEIHLQPQGDLNLYGLHGRNIFLRDFLKKYGINVHVWKHGAYKNMANMFTHSKHSKEHRENVAGILLPIHRQIRQAIYASRHKQLNKQQYYGNNNDDFDKFWTMIERAGSLPADVAQQIGFVDHLPLKNPLEKLLKENNEPVRALSKLGDEKSENKTGEGFASHPPDREASPSVGGEDPWKLKTNADSFTADSRIAIDAYARLKAKARSKDADDWKFFRSLKKAAEGNDLVRDLLSLVGYRAPYFNLDEKKYSEEKARAVLDEETIAIIKINGTIGEATARKAEKALQSVKQKQNIKCVVLRVDSPGGSVSACESLYQEIRDIPQKVVVSFGNVSASGGYYISSGADRIFASSSTITGSIGVVMVRMDFTDLAKKHGIAFDSVPTGALSGSNDPFCPINKRMDNNFANQADRSYRRFKSLVSDGRNIDTEAVEAVAKGRVWTGEQASKNGLVDQLGGLREAVAFAQEHYTASGSEARVVHWPPKKSLWESFKDVDLPGVLHAALGSFFLDNTNNNIPASAGGNNYAFSAGGGITTTANPYSFFSSLLSIPPVASNVMLTMNENAAIRCMLDDANVAAEIPAALNDCIV